jgi:hypothetical protein
MNSENYFDSLVIRKLDNSYAKQFMRINHYTHSCAKCSIAYGIFRNDELECVIVYGQPSGKFLAQSIWNGGNEQECLELLRLFSFDRCSKNIESWSISKSIKELKKDMPQVKVLVSYADGSAGHVGYIYQASSWDYVGKGSTECKIFIDGVRQHRRNLYDIYGTSSIVALKEKLGNRLLVENERISKNKYIKIIRDRKNIIKKLKVKSMPYPKGDIKYYNNEENEYEKVNSIVNNLGGIFSE